MKKSTYILLAVITILICLVVFLSHKVAVLRKEDNHPLSSGKVDTVYVSRLFDIKPDLKIPVIPERVYMFLKDSSSKVADIRWIHDTVTVVEKDSSSFNYNTVFLTQYPNNPKFVQMTLDNKLTLAFLNTQGQVYQEVYPVDLENFCYRYTDNLTSEKISFWSKLQPFAQVTFRPINTLIDLDLGVTYKTTKMQYEIGINGFYYNPMPSHFGYDFFLRFRYNF